MSRSALCALAPFPADRGPGGGHHVGAKKAFLGAPGYEPNKAPAIPSSEMARLGVHHSTVTGAQARGYSAFSKTGEPLTLDVMSTIETNALIEGGMGAEMASTTVAGAFAPLKAAGISPVSIPWAR